jgi:small subunit ribosomal protein S6
MVLVNPELSDEDLTAQVDRVSDYIGSAGGQVTNIKRDTPWGRRRLAYPIEQFRDATYVLYHFDSAPARVIDIERELKLDERVIRYLVVRYEAPEVTEEAEEQDAAAESGEDASAEATAPSDENGADNDVEQDEASTDEDETAADEA